MNHIRKVDIDWDARKIRIKQSKTGNPKTIGPVGPTTIDILREFAKASRSEFVFSQGGNITPKFYRILRQACEAVGVPYGRKTPSGLVLHDARHTATTFLLDSGVSSATVREWMGWSESAFVQYYGRHTVAASVSR
jgi:integrase